MKKTRYKRDMSAKPSKRNAISFEAFGGAKEVGRSAFILQDRDRKILLDAGIKLQAFDETLVPVGLKEQGDSITGIILSHAHIDHSGFIPAVFEAGFAGSLFMTEPTLDISFLLWKDHLKIEKRKFWDENGLIDAYDKTVGMKYRQKKKISDGITVEFFPAGHILGSAMSLIDWDGFLILYTGDINDQITPLFNGYNLDGLDEEIDLVISEGTNGCRNIPLRKDVNKSFKSDVLNRLNKGKKVLVPSFAVGRSQEILTVLSEDIRDYPIYIDGMINTVNQITENYLTPNWVDSAILDRLKEEKVSSPFRYENMISLTRENFENLADYRRHLGSNKGPLVICSTSGMLMPSPIYTHLEYHAPDPENLLAIVGFQAPGTIGREILNGSKLLRLPSRGKPKDIPIRSKVSRFHFSGHVTEQGIKALFEKVKPKNSCLIHCTAKESQDLSKKLQNCFTPGLHEPISFKMESFNG